jgi:hypothetical protein
MNGASAGNRSTPRAAMLRPRSNVVASAYSTRGCMSSMDATQRATNNLGKS